MLDRIMIATDLSDSSGSLVGCMAGLKQLGVTDVALCHVVELRYSLYVPPEMAALLDRQATQLAASGLTVTPILRTGTVWSEIRAAAREYGASLVVVGSHGKSIMKEVAIGSATAEFIEHVDLPVLVLPLSEPGEDGVRHCAVAMGRLLSDVLVASDFSTEGIRAVEHLRSLAPRIGQMTFVHVQEPILLDQPIEFDQQQMDAIDLRHLKDMAAAIDSGRTFPMDILHGKASIEIAGYVNSRDFSLVVLGARGLGTVAGILLGSTTRQVIRRVRTPVLIIPNTVKEDI